MRTSEILLGFVAITLMYGSATAQERLVISPALQAERDQDRRVILQAELRDEKAALSKAQAEYARKPNHANDSAAHRHLENVKALRRELGISTAQLHKPTGSVERVGAGKAPFAGRPVTESERMAAKDTAAAARAKNASPADWVIFANVTGSNTVPRFEQQPSSGDRTARSQLAASPVERETMDPIRATAAPDAHSGAERLVDHAETPFVQLVN
jgi:hypothetical protein